jgi:hypothetical protein
MPGSDMPPGPSGGGKKGPGAAGLSGLLGVVGTGGATAGRVVEEVPDTDGVPPGAGKPEPLRVAEPLLLTVGAVAGVGMDGAPEPICSVPEPEPIL